MRVFAFIFARGGSKGVPGKNIRNLNGKPLIAHSIDIAKNISKISKIFVSTDDKNIADIASKYGAEIIHRPANLAQDDSAEWLAWKHAVEWVYEKKGHFDKFVSLQATSPLRNETDVVNCIKMLDKDTDIVVTMTNTSRSPNFNMLNKN